MLLRSLIILPLLLMASTAPGTPLDVGHDLLQAIEYRNGSGFMDLLSTSLSAQIEASFLRLRELAETDPTLADGLLERAGIEATSFEVRWMSTADLISRILDSSDFPPVEDLVSEKADLKGRDAEVILSWRDGTTLTLQMVWEDSGWRICGSSMLAGLFQ